MNHTARAAETNGSHTLLALTAPKPARPAALDKGDAKASETVTPFSRAVIRAALDKGDGAQARETGFDKGVPGPFMTAPKPRGASET